MRKSGRKNIAWDRWPLGLFPDSTLALNLGCSTVAVGVARRKRGLPHCPPMTSGCRRRGIAWEDWPLGLVCDSALALNLGCTTEAVFYARKQRGIAAFRPMVPRCDRRSFKHLLGTRTDREVAALSGVSTQQVAYARRAERIRSTRIDWGTEPLGSVPDCVLAKKHGVDNTVVAKARWLRGVTKWREQRTCPCGESFVAVHRRQRFCRYRCQRYYWQLVNRHGHDPATADLLLALWAYKKSLKEKT